MKRILQILLAVATIVMAAPLGHAESVVAVPRPASLQSGGGVLTLGIEVHYAGTPAAMGLELGLPDGWSLVSVEGEDVPQIAPSAGTTERVECAWTSSPTGGASLELKIAYPASSVVRQLVGTVLLRREGKVLELKVQVPLGD